MCARRRDMKKSVETNQKKLLAMKHVPSSTGREIKRRKRKRDPQTHQIPDDIVEEIMLKLPVTSLMRFQTVSKPWRSLMRSKGFGESYMAHHESKDPKTLVHLRRFSKPFEKHQETTRHGRLCISELKGDCKQEFWWMVKDDKTWEKIFSVDLRSTSTWFGGITSIPLTPLVICKDSNKVVLSLTYQDILVSFDLDPHSPVYHLCSSGYYGLAVPYFPSLLLC